MLKLTNFASSVPCVAEFLSIHDKEAYPEYHNQIRKPMSIVKMKSKLLRQKYENFNQFKEDFRILASNAKLVCVKGDVTWQNITLLEDEFHLFVFLQEERAKKHQIVIDEDPMPAKVAKTDVAWNAPHGKFTGFRIA